MLTCLLSKLNILEILLFGLKIIIVVHYLTILLSTFLLTMTFMAQVISYFYFQFPTIQGGTGSVPCNHKNLNKCGVLSVPFSFSKSARQDWTSAMYIFVQAPSCKLVWTYDFQLLVNFWAHFLKLSPFYSTHDMTTKPTTNQSRMW